MKNSVFYTLMTATLFVTLEPVSKLIAADINPYAITFWRFLVGSLILIPFALRKIKKDKIKITGKDLGIMLLLGTLFICISMVSLQLAVKIADAPSLIAIIFSSNSIFTILFAILILKEKVTRNKLVALVFGIVGVLFCVDFSAGTNLSSVVLAVLAALSFSLYTVLGKKYTVKLSGVIQAATAFFLGSVVLLIILLIGKVDISLSLNIKNLAIIGYLGFFVTGIGYVCYFKALEKGGAIMGSLAFFIKPILTPFVTYFINRIVPDIKTFVAVLCIVVASYFAVLKKRA